VAIFGKRGLGGLLDDRFRASATSTIPSLGAQPAAQPAVDPAILAMVGKPPEKGNNTTRDIAAAIFAVLGDVAMAQGGRKGTAVDSLAKGWGERRETYAKDLLDYENRRKVAMLPGMNAREYAAFAMDPKAWGGHMADAATSRYQAATLNPADTRFLGDGNGAYQAPTRGEQFARSLNLPAGTDAYNSAIRDQELGAQGPTGFANTKEIEALKAANRLRFEGVRQGNRQALRTAPTYRDLNPPAPRIAGVRNAPRRAARPTATGPNGERVEWNGKEWAPIR